MKDAMPASRSLPQGTIVGRYTIGRRIGRGGMGSVYEAVHNDLKKPVAIKTLDPKFADDPEVSLRFLREGEAAARIRHPHVVDIYDVGTEGDITYLVMELLAGEDLRARIARSGPLSPEAVADILLPVCAALATAHEGHVVHRDMKPANIFLARRSDGRSDASVVPKILDFGISKTVDGSMDGLTSTGSLLGTPHYMSPEQAHGGVPVDHRADIYSLGVVLYESVTGARPFTGQSTYQLLNRIVEGQFPPPRAIKPRLDADLERIILRAMARQPHERYPTATELGAALLPFGGRRTQAMWAPVLQPSTGALIEEAAYAEPVLPSTGSQTLRGEASTRLPSSPEAGGLHHRAVDERVGGGLRNVLFGADLRRPAGDPTARDGDDRGIATAAAAASTAGGRGPGHPGHGRDCRRRSSRRHRPVRGSVCARRRATHVTRARTGL